MTEARRHHLQNRFIVLVSLDVLLIVACLAGATFLPLIPAALCGGILAITATLLFLGLVKAKQSGALREIFGE